MSLHPIEEAREKSIELLKSLLTEKGFVASTTDIDNYKRIWGRDGAIISLAALTTGEPDLVEGFKQTMRTLRDHQDHTGRIPSNVSLDKTSVSYGTTVGRIDSTIWFVISITKYVSETNDMDFWKEHEASVQKAVFYLDCLELNGRGLIYIPAGGDWADEYVNRGYVLFDQCLYAVSLFYYHAVTGDERSQSKYRTLLNLIAINYFPDIKNSSSPFVYQDAIFKLACKTYTAPLPISSFTPFDVMQEFDLLALSLFFNLPIAPTQDRAAMQEKYENDCLSKTDFPILPAFCPVITPEHALWDSLAHNFLFRFKNEPYQFHNGGLWPMVHGWYLASKLTISEKEMSDFAQVLKRDEYIFPEFYHGKTFEAMGTFNLGFSASGYLLAYNRYTNGPKPFTIN